MGSEGVHTLFLHSVDVFPLIPSLLSMPKPGYMDGTEAQCVAEPTPAARGALVPGARVDARGADASGVPGGWLAATITAVAPAAGVEGCIKFRLALADGGEDVEGWLPLAQAAVPPRGPAPSLAVRPRHEVGDNNATTFAPGDQVEARVGRAWWPATVVAAADATTTPPPTYTIRIEPAAGVPAGVDRTVAVAALRRPPPGGPWAGVATLAGERIHPDEWAKRAGPPRPLLVQGFALDAACLPTTLPGATAGVGAAAAALVAAAGVP